MMKKIWGEKTKQLRKKSARNVFKEVVACEFPSNFQLLHAQGLRYLYVCMTHTTSAHTQVVKQERVGKTWYQVITQRPWNLIEIHTQSAQLAIIYIPFDVYRTKKQELQANQTTGAHCTGSCFDCLKHKLANQITKQWVLPWFLGADKKQWVL